MDCGDQDSHVFRRRRRQNPVAKIEDMPWLRSCGLNNVERRISRRFRSRQQDHGVEVALQRNARSHLPASNADIRRPVESHGIAAAGGDAGRWDGNTGAALSGYAPWP